MILSLRSYLSRLAHKRSMIILSALFVSGGIAGFAILPLLVRPAHAPVSSGQYHEQMLPRSASELHDSMGVIAHVSARDYPDAPKLLEMLKQTGLRHIRNNASVNQSEPSYQKGVVSLHLLAQNGIKFHFTTPAPPGSSPDEPAIQAAVNKRLDYIASNNFQKYTESIETFNEYDGGRGQSDVWARTLAQAQSYMASQRSRLAPETKILSPALIGHTLARTAPELGKTIDRTAFDSGNIHSYFGGRAPELPFADALSGKSFLPDSAPAGKADDMTSRLKYYAWFVSRDAPMVISEMGYTTDPADSKRTSESAAAVYIPRAYLEAFRSGVVRTYLYELVDEPHTSPSSEQHYGLFRADGSLKPAAQALHNLTQLLTDTQPSAALTPLPVHIDADAQVVRRVLVQKSDGSYLLILWRPQSVYEMASDTDVKIVDKTVAISLARQYDATYYSNLSQAAPQTQNFTGTHSFSLPVSAGISILHLK